jgi:hypothetical protein
MTTPSIGTALSRLDSILHNAALLRDLLRHAAGVRYDPSTGVSYTHVIDNAERELHRVRVHVQTHVICKEANR